MIPKVKTWRARDIQTGQTFEIQTVTKRMVKIILFLDYAIPSWRLRVSVKRR